MSAFPPTSLTLLHKLAATATGESEAAWTRFFELYMPAIRRFAEWHGAGRDPDDIVQEVFLQLVEILQNESYSNEKGRFRAFLATLIRRRIIDLYRKDVVRGNIDHLPIDDIELSTPPEQIALIDTKWKLARHEAAVDHVLTKTALAEQSKAIYRAHVLEGKSATDVARKFGVEKNLVAQIKFRIDRMIAVIEAQFCIE